MNRRNLLRALASLPLLGWMGTKTESREVIETEPVNGWRTFQPAPDWWEVTYEFAMETGSSLSVTKHHDEVEVRKAVSLLGEPVSVVFGHLGVKTLHGALKRVSWVSPSGVCSSVGTM